MGYDHAIITSEGWHVGRLAAAIRREDAGEATAIGHRPRRAVWISYRAAIYSKTVFVEGDIAAMFGLGGDMLSREGAPWLVTTPAIERIPVTFIKEARREVGRMLELKPILRNYVWAEYRRAIRFLEVLGFKIHPAELLGPLQQPFHLFTRTREDIANGF